MPWWGSFEVKYFFVCRTNSNNFWVNMGEANQQKCGALFCAHGFNLDPLLDKTASLFVCSPQKTKGKNKRKLGNYCVYPPVI